jgi:hypothetical protein
MKQRNMLFVVTMLMFSAWSCSLTATDASSDDHNLTTSVLGLLVETPAINAVDVELRLEISELPGLWDDIEARLPQDVRDRMNRDGSHPVRPSPNRVVRERWRIASDGSARLDESYAVRRESSAEEAPWKRTTITLPDSGANGLPARQINLIYDTKIAHVSPGNMGYRDWRFLGTVAFLSRYMEPLRVIVGKSPPPPHLPTDATMDVLRKAFRVLSMETGLRIQSDKSVDRVRIGLVNGQPLIEFLIDTKDHRRCYEITAYDIDGTIKEIIRANRFEAVDDDLVYPRQAEIIEYRDGKEIRQSRVNITSVQVPPDLPSNIFALDEVIPAGWQVADHRVTPPKVYVKGE